MCTSVCGYVQECSVHRGLKRVSDLWDMGVQGPLEQQEMLVAAEPALQQHSHPHYCFYSSNLLGGGT